MSKKETHNNSSGVIEKIKKTLQKNMEEDAFDLWIKPLSWVENSSRSKGIIYLYAVDRFMAAYVKSHFLEEMQKVAKAIIPEITLALKDGSYLLPSKKKKKQCKHQAVPMKLPGMNKLKCPILSDKTFENFVVEEGFNHMAYAICLSVCNTPSGTSGSILLYGPSGSGKSHLLFSIANRLLTEKNVLYTTAINFSKEYVKARGPEASKNAYTLFDKKYASCDILLIDEVEALTGKLGTKKELREIIKTLREGGATVISASTLSPHQLREKLIKGDKDDEGDALVTMIAGSAFDIKPLSKKDLIKIKASSFNLSLGQEIFDYLAATLNDNNHITSSILKSMSVRNNVGEDITLQIATKLVADYIGEEKSKLNLTLEIIAKIVKDAYGVKDEDFSGKSRQPCHVLPRKVFAFLAKEYTSSTLTEIGAVVGRNHSGMGGYLKDISILIKTDPSFKKQLELIRKKLKPYHINK